MTNTRHAIALAFLALTALAPPAQAQLATYTLASQPMLDIGSTDPTSSQRFQQIRSVRILPGGRLLVADGLTNEIRLFESTGAHVKTFGGSGLFVRLAWVGHMNGDSLLAVDFQRMRGFIFDSQGNLGRVFRVAIAAEHYMAIPQGTFADGTIVSLAGPPREVTDSAGGNWVFIALVLSRSNETLAGRITPIPQRWCPTDGCARRTSPYQALWAVGGERLFYFRPDRREIVAYDHTGRAVKSVPLSSLSGIPDRLLALQAMLVSVDGSLWLQLSPRSWLVLDQHGRPQRLVEVPPELKPLEVSNDFVLGVHKDANAVERVRLYRLNPAR